MYFKEGVDPNEFNDLSEHTQQLLKAADAYCIFHFDKYVTVTSMARDGDPGSLHCVRPCRAADIRAHDFTKEQIRRLTAFLNMCFPYGRSGKPSAWYHDSQGHIWGRQPLPDAHIHLQSPD